MKASKWIKRTKHPNWLLISLITLIATLILSLTITSTQVQAAPLLDIPITVTQPDGTTLDAYISGDETFNYLHDNQGKVILQHPETGFWVYATLDTNGVLTASNNVAVNNGLFYNTSNLARIAQPIASQGITTSDINFTINAHLVNDHLINAHPANNPSALEDTAPYPLEQTVLEQTVLEQTS